jgi:hypothetical protein
VNLQNQNRCEPASRGGFALKTAVLTSRFWLSLAIPTPSLINLNLGNFIEVLDNFVPYRCQFFVVDQLDLDLPPALPLLLARSMAPSKAKAKATPAKRGRPPKAKKKAQSDAEESDAENSDTKPLVAEGSEKCKIE